MLHKITWKEFEKIGQVIIDYKPLAAQAKNDEWFDHMSSLFSKVKKQPYNVDVDGLEKKDFIRMATIIDMWNVVKNPVEMNNKTPYDGECDVISSKLQRAYFKEFNEQVFHE